MGTTGDSDPFGLVQPGQRLGPSAGRLLPLRQGEQAGRFAYGEPDPGSGYVDL